MNAVLAEILRTEQVISPSGETHALRNHISPEEGAFLQEIIRQTNATVSLEVGLAYGISAMFICDALSRSARTRHIVIDPNQFEWRTKGAGVAWEGIGLKNLRDAGYDGIIDFREQPSHLALPELESEGIRLDFAFIDGWHTFDHTLVDFFFIDRLLRVGGVVAIDDVEWPSVRKVCRYIVTNRRYRVLRCLAPRKALRFMIIRRILRACAARSSKVGKVLRSELALPDTELGLLADSRCVAFVKEADDTRWNFSHYAF